MVKFVTIVFSVDMVKFVAIAKFPNWTYPSKRYSKGAAPEQQAFLLAAPEGTNGHI